MNLLKSGTIVTSSSMFNAAVSFGGIVLLAKLVPSTELGTFFLFQAALGLLSIPADIGINGAIEKRVSEGQAGSEILGTALTVKLVLLGLLTWVLLLFRGPVQSYLDMPVVHLLVVGLLFQQTSQVSIRTLRGEMRVAQASILQTLRKTLWIFGGVLSAFLDLGAIGLVYALLGSYVLISVAGGILQQTGVTGFSRESLRSIVNYSRYNAITSVGGSVYNWVDTAMLGLFVGGTLIAAYEIAWRVSRLGLVVSRSVVVTTFPKISEWASRKEYETIAHAVSKSLVPALVLAIPSFFGILLLAPDILTVVYGPEYVVAAAALTVLSLETVIRAANQVYSRCLHALNQPGLGARATVVAIGANLVLNWTFIAEFGVLGAAVATSVSFVLKFVIEYRYLSQFVPVVVPTRDAAVIIGASFAMVTVLYFLKQVLPFRPLWSLVIMLSVGVSSYLGFLLLSTSMREYISAVVTQVRPDQ